MHLVTWLEQVDESWSLFLDRDGTINVRLIDDYVTDWSQFSFLPDAIQALEVLTPLFARTLIVTNQQGVGKGLMTSEDLNKIHKQMLDQLNLSGIIIDQVYSCTQLADEWNNCRKPSQAMGLQAATEFPQIQFDKCIMIGDMPSDILFGQGLKMKTVYLGKLSDLDGLKPDIICSSLYEFSNMLLTALEIA